MIARLRATGGQTLSFFRQLMKDAGYDEVIIGDGTPISTMSSAGDFLIPDDGTWDFYFIVTGFEFEDHAKIRCIINQYKPAHTAAWFEYEGTQLVYATTGVTRAGDSLYRLTNG